MAGFFEGPKPIPIAHRGGAGAFTFDRFKVENTLETFHAAAKLGYKYIETDAIVTADGQVVVMHVTTDRFEAMLHKNSAPDAHKMQKLFYKQLKKRLQREVPTLETVLKSLPETKFIIDSKTDEVVEPLAKLIKKLNAENRVLLNSFYIHRVKQMQELVGHQAAYGVIINRYPRFFNRRYRALMRGDYHNQGFEAIAMPMKFVSQKLVGMLHNQGLKVAVWTPNSKENILRAKRTGVDGIISDNIKLLKQMLSR